MFETFAGVRTCTYASTRDETRQPMLVSSCSDACCLLQAAARSYLLPLSVHLSLFRLHFVLPLEPPASYPSLSVTAHSSSSPTPCTTFFRCFQAMLPASETKFSEGTKVISLAQSKLSDFREPRTTKLASGRLDAARTTPSTLSLSSRSLHVHVGRMERDREREEERRETKIGRIQDLTRITSSVGLHGCLAGWEIDSKAGVLFVGVHTYIGTRATTLHVVYVRRCFEILAPRRAQPTKTNGLKLHRPGIRHFSRWQPTVLCSATGAMVWGVLLSRRRLISLR